MFGHVRIIIAMVIGLGITRLLSGVAGLIQHPGYRRASTLHILWVLAVFLEFVLLWWWDVPSLRGVGLTFRVYVSQILYAILLYMAATLLFPDKVGEYDDLEEFFIDKRYWFFLFLSLTWFVEFIKLKDPYVRLNLEFAAQAGISVAIFVAAILFKNRIVQISLACLYISRLIYSAFY